MKRIMYGVSAILAVAVTALLSVLSAVSAAADVPFSEKQAHTRKTAYQRRQEAQQRLDKVLKTQQSETRSAAASHLMRGKGAAK